MTEAESMPIFERNPIQPVYSQTRANEVIELGLYETESTFDGQTHSHQCQVSMEFVPDDRLIFRSIPSNESRASGNQLIFELFKRWTSESADPVKLRLSNRTVEFEVLEVGTNSEGGWNFIPKMSVVSASKQTTDIKWIIAHLFNFPEFSSSSDFSLQTDRSWRRCGMVDLIADGWRITIAATDQTDELTKSLEQSGGYVITHVAKIERTDGSVFSSDSCEEVLVCLHHFLSFALGRWAGLALPVGFADSGERVFEQWGLPMAASGKWSGGQSWFDLHHGQLLSEVFPGFWALWNETLWQKAIRECLYWYIAANERGTGIGIDTGLILCQTALEHLAWTVCVKVRKLVSAQAFSVRGLNAADKIRLLITSLGIPASIPANLVDLAKPPSHVSGGKWDDGPHAVTEIRNSIIHPDAKLTPTHGAYIDAWKLSIWFVEMCLLRLCEHRGSYGNRLLLRRAGRVEKVPWSS